MLRVVHDWRGLRALSSMSSTRSLPIIRLPTILATGQCFSVAVDPPEESRVPGSLPEARVSEACAAFNRSFAVLADGASIGVVAHVVDEQDDAAELGVVHLFGGERLQLLSVGGLSAAGGRLGTFAPLVDDTLATQPSEQLLREAEAASALLRTGRVELEACTLDDELGLVHCPPSKHPLWAAASAPPDGSTAAGAAALSLWLAAHLPLATSVRTHLLACQCPLKRAQDCVDAMRLLSEEGHGADRYNAAGDPDSLPKFRVVYDTAEASGCELEPPRSIVDWARRT